jgi:RNA polymerase sigma-70 factor (ECF subfamily)
VDACIDPDLGLVERCRDPESEDFEPAFEALYYRYRDRVYSIAYRVTGNSADAMDVVQQSFSRVFRQIGSFRQDSLFSTWLFRLVVNCSIDSKRQQNGAIRRRTSGFHRISPGSEPLDAGATSAEEAAQTSELGEHVHACLQQVSPKLRAILVLRYLEGLSYEALAATLEISIGTVKSRLARAHLAIQRVMDGTLEPFDYPSPAPSEAPRPSRNPSGGSA